MPDPLTSVFDLAVLGTGLTESIVAAAAARCGLSVLHVDAATFYGGAESSLPLPQFLEWARTRTPPRATRSDGSAADADGWWPLVAQDTVAPGGAIAELPPTLAAVARRFTIDFSPRLVLSRGAVTDLLVHSGVAQHVDFKAADATYYVDATEPNSGDPKPLRAEKVPASKGDVFGHLSLSLMEKHHLMRFLQFTLDLLHADTVWPDVTVLNEAALGARRSLLRPQNKSPSAIRLDAHRNDDFISFLCGECSLSAPVARMLSVAVAMVGGGSSPGGSATTRTTAEHGMRRLLRYVGAMGRFGTTPFIAPMYGYGELAQAFCRACAVHGGVYMLRTTPEAARICTAADWPSLEGGLSAAGSTVDSDAATAASTTEAVITTDSTTDSTTAAVIAADAAVAATAAATASTPAGNSEPVESGSHDSCAAPSAPPSPPPAPILLLRLSGGHLVRARRVLAGRGYSSLAPGAAHRSSSVEPVAGAGAGPAGGTGGSAATASAVGSVVLITNAPMRAFLPSRHDAAAAEASSGAGEQPADSVEVFSFAPGAVCLRGGVPASPAALVVQQGSGTGVCPDGYYVIHVRALLAGNAQIETAGSRCASARTAAMAAAEVATLRSDAVAAASGVADALFAMSETGGDDAGSSSSLPHGMLCSGVPLAAASSDGGLAESAASPQGVVLWRCSFSTLIERSDKAVGSGAGADVAPSALWVRVPPTCDDDALAAHEDDVPSAAEALFRRLCPGAAFFAAATAVVQPPPTAGIDGAETSASPPDFVAAAPSAATAGTTTQLRADEPASATAPTVASSAGAARPDASVTDVDGAAEPPATGSAQSPLSSDDEAALDVAAALALLKDADFD